ncbi:hypothetical protein CFOL_v3_13166, partial [Cephalotus follicularis]
FTFRSILETRDIIRKGSRWSVGNGQSIDFWNQPWLPNDLKLPRPSPLNILNLDAKVNDLINSSMGCCDVDLVNLCFEPKDARTIYSAPLSPNQHSDKLVWDRDPKGMFLV